MNFFSKNRILFWLLIFLVVINISALITFLVVVPSAVKKQAEPVQTAPATAMKDLLSLDPSQSTSVDSTIARYRDITGPLSAEIRECRANLLGELENDIPDTVAISKYLAEINAIQGKMQRFSVQQYLDLKKICTPEQCLRLSSLYSDMYGCPGPGMGKGMGKGKGMMHRNRIGRGG